MKVLIIEDERLASQKLCRLIKEVDKDIEVLDILESVESATNWLLKNPYPELIFMDIQLEDGLCFEIFENIDLEIPVIFTTAFDEYSLKAFKVNSVDYLLKPIDADELKKAIQKYSIVHKRKIDFTNMETLLKHLHPRRKERFLIKIGEHFRSIQITDINCFFIKNRCSFIKIAKGKIYTIDYSLDKVEKMIDSNLFFRVNRNFIINFKAIYDIVIYSSNRLKIKLENWSDNDEILVSRERVSDFKKWMDR